MSKNQSAKHYQENKEKLGKKPRERCQNERCQNERCQNEICQNERCQNERCQNLSKEQQEKKRQYGCERYTNLSEDEKNKLVKRRKKIL